MFSKGKKDLLRLAEVFEKIEAIKASEDIDAIAKELGLELSKALRPNVLMKNIDDDYEIEVKKRQLSDFLEKRIAELAEEI